jgi:hypothetical protein
MVHGNISSYTNIRVNEYIADAQQDLSSGRAVHRDGRTGRLTRAAHSARALRQAETVDQDQKSKRTRRLPQPSPGGRPAFCVPRRRQKLQRGKRPPLLGQASFKELRFKLAQFGLEETLIPINVSLVRA